MPSFEYKAVSGSGQIVVETMEAASEQIVTKELFNKGMRPIAVKAVKGQSAGATQSSGGLFSPKIKTTELVLFTRQLVTLLKAGVPMLTALEALATQTSKAMGEVLDKIYVDVMSGKSLSQALDPASGEQKTEPASVVQEQLRCRTLFCCHDRSTFEGNTSCPPL